MRIFALETDTDKLNRSFLSADEQIVLKVRYHGFLFIMHSIGAVFSSIVIIAAGVGAAFANIPSVISVPVLLIAWLVFVVRPLLRAFIDWQYDELVVTTEKIILVNQSSIIRQEIQQMNLENLASVKALTQYGGIFPFGKIQFDLKEGTGMALHLKFIPNAQQVCSSIGNCLVEYQRRKNTEQA